jgi:hypothetical protein
MDEPTAITVPEQPSLPPEVMAKVVIGGDLAELNAAQRADYYTAVCRSLGLNPLTKPFEYLTLNGKLRLYALRDCTDQLRRLHGISISITSRERMNDIYIVTARARTRDGREDESTGAVTIGNLKGDALCNALMKAETKSKRRVTLSIAGLGWLDETELETIPQQALNTPEVFSAPPAAAPMLDTRLDSKGNTVVSRDVVPPRIKIRRKVAPPDAPFPPHLPPAQLALLEIAVHGPPIHAQLMGHVLHRQEFVAWLTHDMNQWLLSNHGHRGTPRYREAPPDR